MDKPVRASCRHIGEIVIDRLTLLQLLRLGLKDYIFREEAGEISILDLQESVEGKFTIKLCLDVASSPWIDSKIRGSA